MVVIENSTQTANTLPLLPQYADIDISLEARRPSHFYRVSGYSALMPSVTTVLKIIDKSGPLMGWAKRTALDRVRETLLESDLGRAKLSREDYSAWVDEILVDAKSSPDRERDKAAANGAAAHKFIEQSLLGERPVTPDHLLPAVDGALAFLHREDLDLVATEPAIFHPSHFYAGMVDYVGRGRDGRLAIADWKRSKGIYPEHALQVVAYAKAVEVMTGERVAAAYVVRLPRGDAQECAQRYEARKVRDMESAFRTYLAAQNLWQSIKTERNIWA